MSDMVNTDGDGSLSGIDVTKYNNLLIPNEHGYFLVTDEDINRYNELDDEKKIRKEFYTDPTIIDSVNFEIKISAMIAGLSNEYSDIIDINNKKIDYKTEHKIYNFKNYKKFYKICSENFNSIIDKNEKNKFIELHKVRPKQDVSKLLQLDKERHNKLVNLLKGYSETESLIKYLVLMRTISD